MRAIAAVLFMAFSFAVSAQQYPTKPARLVIPYPPGGVDITARLLMPTVEKELGQPWIVDYRSGASGTIGHDHTAKSAPDGYTLDMVVGFTWVIQPAVRKNAPYDPIKDFTPISLLIEPLGVIVANNNFPPKDIKELIDYAKKNPGKVAFGSSGIGAAAHLTTELFKQTTGTDMLHVPYKGTAPALTGLMGSDIQILVDVPSTLMPHVRGGKIKALAMFSTKRVPGAQEVPTMAEAGGPPIESSTWLLFLAPAGTPREIVNRLSSETDKVLGSTGIRTRFDTLGIFPGGGTPERAAQFLNDEIARWAKVIKTAGVKADD